MWLMVLAKAGEAHIPTLLPHVTLPSLLRSMGVCLAKMGVIHRLVGSKCVV